MHPLIAVTMVRPGVLSEAVRVLVVEDGDLDVVADWQFCGRSCCMWVSL